MWNRFYSLQAPWNIFLRDRKWTISSATEAVATDHVEAEREDKNLKVNKLCRKDYFPTKKKEYNFFFSVRNVKKIFVVGYDVRISYFHIFRLN